MYYVGLFSLGIKMIKLHPSPPLHKWIKTLATFHDKEIGDYLIDVLREHLPKEIKFDPASEGGRQPKRSKGL
jgi:hypothetical protein